MKTIKELEAEHKEYPMDDVISAELKTLKEVLELIDETWKDRKQTTDKILFMAKFKEELKARIKGK